jgi:HAD superfamily hydrolase (TIGR01509 family)
MGTRDGIQAIVFDFDGLILDTELPHYLTVKEEFEEHGVELPLDQWLGIIGRADHPHWTEWLEDALGVPIEREVIQARRYDKYHELVLRNAVLPGVLDLLDEADRRGIPAAVASSSPADWVVPHLERLGLATRLAAVLTIDDVERGKPWPDLFLAAAAALDARPEQSVAFEDSHNGSKAAKAAGLFCVVAPNELTRTQDFTHADLVVESLADVRLAHLDASVPAAP